MRIDLIPGRRLFEGVRSGAEANQQAHNKREDLWPTPPELWRGCLLQPKKPPPTTW